jgi:hypothetical protein
MMPVLFMEDNRVFDISGDSYAIFRIHSHPYAFMPILQKSRLIRDGERAFSSFVSDYHLYLLSKQLSIKQLRQEMQNISRLPGWTRQTDITLDSFEKRTPFERVNLIAVPLKKRMPSTVKETEISEIIVERLRNIWRGIQDVKGKFARMDLVIPQDVLESSRQQAKELYDDKLRPFHELEPATIHEVEWWLKKGYFRGLGDPELQIPSPFPAQVVSRSGQSVVRPTRTALLTLSNNAIREKRHYLKIHHGLEEESFQSFYTALHVPNLVDHQTPVGYDWLFRMLESARFPIDVAMHIRVENADEAKPKVDRKNKIAKSQINEYRGGEDEDDTDEYNQSKVPEELLEEMESVSSLRRKFRNNQPLMYTTTIFGFGTDSYEELRQKMQDFKTAAKSAGITVINPPTDMKKMWQAFYPFGTALPSEWEIPMDPGILAAAVPFGVRMLGDPIGFHLGKLLTGRPVFMKPDRPILELQKTAAILICGSLGSGKTVLMKYIVYHLLQMGAYCFTNDPKGDWAVFFQHPEIKAVGKLISFTPDSDTTFTPFRLAKTKANCYEAAFGVLELIFNQDNTEIRNTLLGEAISQVFAGEKWDMFEFEKVVHDRIENETSQKRKEEFELIASQLKSLRDHSIGRMVYGEDTGSHLFEEKRFVCAITRGLSLPGRTAKRYEWNYNERLSVAMLYAIITLALRYLMQLPQNVLKGLAWEEFWFLKRFERGRQLYNEALRLSRSEKMIPIMATQNPTDVEASDDPDDDDITGLFGWKFMLRLQSKPQVRYGLHTLMDMPDEDIDDWVGVFSDKYSDGKGLVRDPEGRIGEMQVEILDPHLFKYLKSTPPEGESHAMPTEQMRG